MQPQESAKILQQEIERLRVNEQKLKDDKAALQAEFAKASNPDQVAKIARDAIRDILPEAITQLRTLINSADSESVRASLSKFVVSAGLDKAKFEDDSTSELKDLLQQLAKND